MRMGCFARKIHCESCHDAVDCLLYQEVKTSEAELAAARGANSRLRDLHCNDKGCEYVQKAHTLHNSLVQALATKDAELAKLRALCVSEEKQLRGIALMTDNATATHILMICDRLAAGRGEVTR